MMPSLELVQKILPVVSYLGGVHMTTSLMISHFEVENILMSIVMSYLESGFIKISN